MSASAHPAGQPRGDPFRGRATPHHLARGAAGRGAAGRGVARIRRAAHPRRGLGARTVRTPTENVRALPEAAGVDDHEPAALDPAAPSRRPAESVPPGSACGDRCRQCDRRRELLSPSRSSSLPTNPASRMPSTSAWRLPAPKRATRASASESDLRIGDTLARQQRCWRRKVGYYERALEHAPEQQPRSLQGWRRSLQARRSSGRGRGLRQSLARCRSEAHRSLAPARADSPRIRSDESRARRRAAGAEARPYRPARRPIRREARWTLGARPLIWSTPQRTPAPRLAAAPPPAEVELEVERGADRHVVVVGAADHLDA